MERNFLKLQIRTKVTKLKTFTELSNSKFITMHPKRILAAVIALSFLAACNNSESEKEPDGAPAQNTPVPVIAEETVSYSGDNVNMNGFIAYDSVNKDKRPAVLIVHEWWGLNDYPKTRAKQLAAMGYFVMAVDMFGDGKTADNPKDAEALAGPFYQNPQMAKARFDAALAKCKTYSQVDTTKIAAIGYCFGGGMLLNFAKMGEPIKGIVSFHGSLAGVPATKGSVKAEVLVCHGAADSFVPQKDIDAFKKNMDDAGATYLFKSYHDSKHAFTNPKATEVGKRFNIDIAYNGAADTASWNDMKDFFGKIFR